MAWTTAELDRIWNNKVRHPYWGAVPALPPLVDAAAPEAAGWPARPAGTGWSEERVKRHALAVNDYLGRGLQAGPGGAPGPIDRALTELNRLLLQELPAAGGPAPATYDDFMLRDDLPGLKDVLLRQLTLRGWVLPPDRVKVPLGLLDDAGFYGVMQNFQHVKDVTIGQEHGEWTHFLQWYVLTVAPPFPGCDVKGFYQYLGFQGPAGSAGWGPKLWQVLCDRTAPYYHVSHNYYARDINDFRSPDMLHVSLAGLATGRIFLRTSPAVAAHPGLPVAIDDGNPLSAPAQSRLKWPLLTAVMRKRLDKRNLIYDPALRIYTAAVQAHRARLENALAAITVTLSTGVTVDPVLPGSRLDEFINDLTVTWSDPGVLRVRNEVLADIFDPLTVTNMSLLDPVRDAMLAFRIPTAPLLVAVFAAKETGIRGALYWYNQETKSHNARHGTTYTTDPEVWWNSLTTAEKVTNLTTAAATPFLT